MLAQSLFASVLPSAAPSGDGAPVVTDDDGLAFGRLLDQATRPATPVANAPSVPGATLQAAPSPPGPEVLPPVPDEGPSAKTSEFTGPQINPGEHAVAVKPAGPLRPEVLPPVSDEGASPAVAKPGEGGPQILPGLDDADPSLRPAKDAFVDLDAPRPEVLPTEVGPPPPPSLPPTTAPTPLLLQQAASAATSTVAPSSSTHDPAASTNADADGPATSEAQDETPAPTPQTSPEAPPAEPTPSPAAARTAPPVADAPASRVETTGPAPAVEAAPSADGASPASDAPAFSLSRVAHETLAELSAQILRRLEGRSTRFEMALTPEDLGRVDVSLEVGEDGSLTARLAFDSPAAAAEMRGRADELRRQLEQAGFQLSRDALEFSQRDGSSGRHDAFERRSNRAFAAARALADRAEAAPLITLSLSLSPTRDRVDVKV